MIDLMTLAALLVAFPISFVLSTLVIRLGIPKLDQSQIETKAAPSSNLVVPDKWLPESSSGAVFDLKSTGFWIGLCETFLVFVLVQVGAFSAIAIIIGAKEFVRKEDINRQPAYYLLGTLVNLSFAILFAILAGAVAGVIPR